jgi:predicted alpha/beta hydrolase family esterase
MLSMVFMRPWHNSMKTLASVLLLPGLFNSGPEHWQSLWQRKHPEYHRVEQTDWETPHCTDWVQTLHASICSIGNGPVVLAGHSLACATIAHYAAKHADCQGRVAAAFLVAPSDVEAPTYPPGSSGFNPIPLQKLPFRSVVVASADDPYLTPERAEFFARCWGSRLIKIARAGHINATSGYGQWPEGEALIEQLREIRT